MPTNNNVISNLGAWYYKFAPALNSICAPLKILGISTFIYTKSFSNREFVYCSNRQDWLQYFYEQERFNICPFCNYIKLPKITLWPNASSKELFTTAKKQFAMDYGITITKNNPDSREYFSFAGTANYYDLKNFYVNNINLLKRFAFYFKCSATDILAACNKTKLSASALDTNAFQPPINANKEQLIQEFISKTTLRKYRLEQREYRNIGFTMREIEIIEHLLHNRTSKQIADRLFLSHRTVERYIDKLKDTLNCNSKKGLLAALAEHDFDFYLDIGK